MARTYLVTEAELQSAAVTSAGELTFTRDNGDVISAGVVKGPRGDRGLPGTNGVETAQAMTAYVAEPGNELREEILKASLRDARSVGPKPFIVAHRGAKNVYPEHSAEGYRASYAGGFSPEADVYWLADGTLVCIHDASTGRTMTGPDTQVETMSRADWESRLVLPAGGGGVKSSGYGRPVYFEDYLDEFGGRGLLWPELKFASTRPALVDAFVKAIVDRKLQRSVIPQTNTLAVAERFVAEGMTPLYLASASTTAAQLTSRKIPFVGVSQSITNTKVSEFVAAGITVVSYTVNSKAEAAVEFARGASGVFSDDPFEVSDAAMAESRLQLDDGYLPKAMAARVNYANEGEAAGRSVVFECGAMRMTDSATPLANRVAVRLGSLGYGDGKSAKIRFHARPIGSKQNSQSGAINVYLGYQGAGEPVTELGGSQWRLAMIRRSGIKQAYTRAAAASSPVNVGATAAPSTPYAAPGGGGPEMLFEVEFTATSIFIRNLTLADEALEVAAPAMLKAGSYITIGANQSEWEVRGITAASVA